MSKQHDDRTGPPPPMGEERFNALIESYGAAPERWPEAERAAALVLMEESPDARRRLNEASRLDGALDAAAAPPVPGDLRAAVRDIGVALATRRAGSAPPVLLVWLARPALRGAAMAVAVVLGLAVGMVVTPSRVDDLNAFETLDITLVAGGSPMVGVAQLVEMER